MVNTPFEDNGAAFTTLADEQAWWTALAANSARVRYQQIGESIQGRRLDLVTIGHPSPPTYQQLASSPVVFVGACVHGDEPAGREACMTLARDLSETSDPATASWLESNTVCIVPCINPDGFAAETRSPPNASADINGQYLILNVMEARIVSAVLRDTRPNFIADLHEDTRTSRPQVQYLGPTNPQVAQNLQTAATELINDYLFPAMTSLDFTRGLYDIGNLTLTNLRQVGGARHAVSLLVETHRINQTIQQRVLANEVTLAKTLEFWMDKGVELQAASDAARATKVAEGVAHTAPYDFTNGTVADPQPAGYVLTPQQYESVENQRVLFAIQFRRVIGGDYYASMGQDTQPVLPAALDARAPANVVSAAAVASAPDFAPLNGAVRDGQVVDGQVGIIRGGQFVPAT